MITITWKPKPLHVISALTGILWGRKRCRPPRVAAFPWLGKYSFGTAQAVFRSTEVGGYMSGLSHPHMTNTHTYTGKDNTLRIHCPVTDSALSALVSLSLCFSIHCSGFNSVLCSHHFRDWNVPWFCVVQDKVQNLSLKNLLSVVLSIIYKIMYPPPPSDVQVLSPRSSEHAILPGKRHLADMIQLVWSEITLNDSSGPNKITGPL